MDQKDLTIQKLKNIVYGQKMELYRHEIPHCNCPWQYGYVENNEEINCGTIKCGECSEKFWELLRVKTEKEVDELE